MGIQHTRNLRISIVSAAFFLVGCGGGSSSPSVVSSSSAATDASFPTELALVSPTVSGGGAATGAVIHSAVIISKKQASIDIPEPSDIKKYSIEADDIKEVLSDKTKFLSKFSAAYFLTKEQGYAPCYGPTLNYVDHPDGVSPNNGQLPSGDLGIWRDTVSADGTTNTTACAAAQLNRNVYAASRRVNMGLKALAALRAVSFSSTGSAVSAGTTNDLTAAMTALGIADVVFNSATLSRDSTGDIWSYAVDITYTDPTTSKSYAIQFALQHTRTSSASYPYNGLLTYKISDTVTAGNCPITGTGTDRSVVHVGTLQYNRTKDVELQINHRTGQYCGGISNLPTNLVNSDGQLNPSAKFDMSAGKGWADNFNRFAAIYNPTGGAGHYVYTWQAGYGDGNTRILGVNLNTNNTDGEAWFGFGDAIDTTDGSIKGMICNWAGPGNMHSYQPYAQRQFLQWNTTLATWEVPSGGSDIRYAPTNTCQYTNAQKTAGATFWYDRDLSVATSGLSTQANLIVDLSDSSYPFDLKDKGSYSTIAEMMAGRGFVLPSNF